MSPPASAPAAKYLPGKAYTPRKTTLTSPPTQHPSTSASSRPQIPSTSISPPPIPARSPARVLAPVPSFFPVVKTPVEPSKATAPAEEKTPTWRQRLAAAAAAPPPITTTTSPLILRLPPPSQRIDDRACGDEDYPELIEDDDEVEWQHAQQAQQAGRGYFSFWDKSSLQTNAEENQQTISVFAAAKSPARTEKWSAKMPTRPSAGRDGEKTEEEAKPVGKDHGALKKESLSIRNTKMAKDEDEPGTKDDVEKRFI